MRVQDDNKAVQVALEGKWMLLADCLLAKVTSLMPC